MKATVDTKLFRERLELLTKVSSKHVTLPVLQCVLISVSKENVLELKATNLEISIEASIKSEGCEEGSVAVPSQQLLQLVQLHTKTKITLQKEDNSLAIVGEGTNARLKSMSHDDFPSIPHVEGVGQQLNRKTFSLGVRAAAFAASLSSVKPELGSVYIHQQREHSLTFVATDSFRLMEKTVSQQQFVLEAAILLPQKNALELARVCDTEEDDPVCYLNENQCALAFPSGVYVTSRLTAGSFPDYQQIIPKEYVTTVTVLKDDFLHVLKKSGIFLNKFFQVRLSVSAGLMTVSADSGDVGTVTESVTVETSGEELSLSFNQRYIAEALPHFTEDSITLQFAGVGRSMVITGGNTSMRYLVMPMNK